MCIKSGVLVAILARRQCGPLSFIMLSDIDFMEMEDRALDEANGLDIPRCRRLGVSEDFLIEWRDGATLIGASEAEHYFLEDYPAVKENVQVAADEIDRLTGLGKIFWCPVNSYPKDLDVCSANIILNGKRPRFFHDWTRAGLNPVLTIPDVHYGTMDSLLSNVRPNSYLAGLDFQDCFLHWPIHASVRRRLGIRHPKTRRFGVFLFLPFGLGPAPGINDRNVAEVVRVASSAVGDIFVDSFVDDLRLVNTPHSFESEEEDRVSLTFKLLEFKETCESMGLLVHDKVGKLIWPTQVIDWIGWVIDTKEMLVIMADSKVYKGLALCKEVLDMVLAKDLPSAKHLMSLWGFLNFVANVMRQAKPYAREIGRCIVSAKVFQAWSAGRKRFNPKISLSTTAIKDLLWWVELFHSKPHRKIHHVGGRSFLWHKKLPDITTIQREAWDAGLLVVVGLDASSTIGWGVTVGDHYAQGRWEAGDMGRHINWKELKSFELALDVFPHLLANKIVFVKTDNIVALHYINNGSGRMDDFADLARSIRLKEVKLGIESVAIHLPGHLNITPDALSRYYFDADFRDPNPNRTLRKRLFAFVNSKHGPFTLDGMVADDGHNALVSNFCSPSYPFFEAELGGHRVWLFPPLELIGVVLKFVLEFSGPKQFSCAVLIPDRPVAPWYKLLSKFRRLHTFNNSTDMFRALRQDSFVTLPKVKEHWFVIALRI